jgi:hypothetical protein
MSKEISRRQFLVIGTAASTTLLLLKGRAGARTATDSLPSRTLGRTGAKVSILAFGCGSRFLMYKDEDSAIAILNRAPVGFSTPVVGVNGSKPLRAGHSSKPQIASSGTGKHLRSSAFKRVRVSQNEIDYFAEDVTIRRFTSPPASAQVRDAKKEVNLGDNVTVRYFESKTAGIPQTLPPSTPAEAIESSTPVSKWVETGVLEDTGQTV